MDVWKIVLIVYGILTLITFLMGMYVFIDTRIKEKKWEWGYLAIGLFLIPFFFFYALFHIFIYIDGFFIRLYNKYLVSKYKKKEEIENVDKDEEIYRDDLPREELPRTENGIDCFEFEENMGLSNNDYYGRDVREIVYVENEYCESLNDFFIRHKDLRLYHMYRFIYLPNLCREFEKLSTFQYLFPSSSYTDNNSINIDSTYPIEYLWYPDDAKKIKHGMMFFVRGKEKHGIKYIKGHYYPLEEGSDEKIIAQLDAIVKKVHYDHTEPAFFSKQKWEKPQIEEGSTEEYADSMHLWVVTDDEVAGIVQEIRDRIERLQNMGIGRKFIMDLLEEKQKLSRLVITKDYRIILPDYHNMEIKMEPINKAVYLLFLRHPEGIIFKHLPDYRNELAEIYQKIKPLGLNEKALKTIEDVTNPYLNSINEKCARIRGAFISQFDDQMAQHYYIFGFRSEPKKITLPRDLVIWE